MPSANWSVVVGISLRTASRAAASTCSWDAIAEVISSPATVPAIECVVVASIAPGTSPTLRRLANCSTARSATGSATTTTRASSKYLLCVPSAMSSVVQVSGSVCESESWKSGFKNRFSFPSVMSSVVLVASCRSNALLLKCMDASVSTRLPSVVW